MFSSAAILKPFSHRAHRLSLRRVSHHAFLIFFCSLLLLPAAASAATALTSARIWPAQDYTRVTLESAAPLQFQLLMLKNPDRLALDVDDLAVTPTLEELSAKIGAADPYVKSVRIGRPKPGTVRLVFDLKADGVTKELGSDALTKTFRITVPPKTSDTMIYVSGYSNMTSFSAASGSAVIITKAAPLSKINFDTFDNFKARHTECASVTMQNGSTINTGGDMLNQRAEDSLMGAPSEVTPKQLRELHIRLALPEKK